MTAVQQKRPIGELLKEKGLITDGHIQLALQDQAITGKRLGETLEKLAFVSEYDVATTIAQQEGREFVDVDQVVPASDTMRLFNMNLCLNHDFLPLQHDADLIQVLTGTDDIESLEQLITRMTGLQPMIQRAEKGKLNNAIRHYFYFLENPVEKLLEREVTLLSQDVDDVRSLDPFIDAMFQLAVKFRATDIHLRPMDEAINVAFRVDGVMRPMFSLPRSMKRVISTFKMRADMDIAEQRLPQDGSFSARILNNSYDFRVSTTICPYGENMVLRVLPMSSNLLGLEQLGFEQEDVDIIRNIFNAPYGIVLLTGPTGSGKTTTLYAAVRTLNLTQKNVITVENPIEYRLPLVRQTEINLKSGYTFANAIRYFLRHDPDVILVGEVRDSETAQTAISASETGHLVLSTLHTNTALGALPRLRSLGIDPFMLAESLVGVVSQRLVRRICPHCRETYAASAEDQAYLHEPSVEMLWRGAGCEACSHTGYLGRTLVYEVLKPTRHVLSLISRDERTDRLAEAAREEGFQPIFDTAKRKVLRGVTTVEEMVRVLGLG